MIVPCRGLDPGLENNLAAFATLDYADYRLVLVTSDPADPCVPVLRSVQDAAGRDRVAVVFAGPARGRGQKVHNLLGALEHLRDRDEVVAFGDSDGRPREDWLRYLVGALDAPGVGLATGFRWYLAPSGGWASVLRAVWNAGILGLLDERSSPFAWGGAMAARRETLERLPVRRWWAGALSDDYALSRAVREAGLDIRFVPRCLAFTHEDCRLRDLLRWSARQLAITRVYHPRLWRMGFASEILNNTAFWGGIVVAGTSLARAAPVPGLSLAGLLAAIVVARGTKAALRLHAVMTVFPEHRGALHGRWGAYVFGGPLASLVTLAGLVRTLFSREIEWRGIRYRMRSPSETEIVAR